jgi:hypothetical protein
MGIWIIFRTLLGTRVHRIVRPSHFYWSSLTLIQGPNFPQYGPAVAPVFQQTDTSTSKKWRALGNQLSIRLSYAITVCKSQGLTLPKVVLDPSQTEQCLGLSYVAVSRLKFLDGL